MTTENERLHAEIYTEEPDVEDDAVVRAYALGTPLAAVDGVPSIRISQKFVDAYKEFCKKKYAVEYDSGILACMLDVLVFGFSDRGFEDTIVAPLLEALGLVDPFHFTFKLPPSSIDFHEEQYIEYIHGKIQDLRVPAFSGTSLDYGFALQFLHDRHPFASLERHLVMKAIYGGRNLSPRKNKKPVHVTVFPRLAYELPKHSGWHYVSLPQKEHKLHKLWLAHAMRGIVVDVVSSLTPAVEAWLKFYDNEVLITTRKLASAEVGAIIRLARANRKQYVAIAPPGYYSGEDFAYSKACMKMLVHATAFPAVNPAVAFNFSDATAEALDIPSDFYTECSTQISVAKGATYMLGNALRGSICDTPFVRNYHEEGLKAKNAEIVLIDNGCGRYLEGVFRFIVRQVDMPPSFSSAEPVPILAYVGTQMLASHNIVCVPPSRKAVKAENRVYQVFKGALVSTVNLKNTEPDKRAYYVSGVKGCGFPAEEYQAIECTTGYAGVLGASPSAAFSIRKEMAALYDGEAAPGLRSVSLVTPHIRIKANLGINQRRWKDEKRRKTSDPPPVEPKKRRSSPRGGAKEERREPKIRAAGLEDATITLSFKDLKRLLHS
jgi:hypothetical protein